MVLRILHGLKGAVLAVFNPMVFPLALCLALIYVLCILLPIALLIAPVFGFLEEFVKHGKYESNRARYSSTAYRYKEKLWSVLGFLETPVHKLLGI